MPGPLSRYRIIELAGIGPGPYAGQLLADMGAEVIVAHRADFTLPTIDGRGKRSIIVDIRKPQGAQIILDLTKSADALIEGMRPGVTERLGLGPKDCHAVNPKLVYGRMTGWGQTGPWAKLAGHDINYIAITGALEAIGEAGRPPAPPLNLLGDYGGGSLFLVNGILAALLQAEKTGKGDIIDAAIIDGTSSMMGIIYSLSTLGMWQPERQANLLDGGRPYYRCYATSDERFMAVGCIEPQFFALMLGILKINAEAFGGQNDPKKWAKQHERLEAVFAAKTRDEWADIFGGTDACVTPVLTYLEAADHPQNKARGGHIKSGPYIHPRPAPGFDSTKLKVPTHIPQPGSATKDVLATLGYDSTKIDTLLADNIIKAG